MDTLLVEQGKKQAKKKIEQKGRKGDKIIAHLTPGEIVIPRAFAEDDDFRTLLAQVFKENGGSLEKFIVGSGKNKVNPETGYMEFGWDPFKPIKKFIRHPKKIFTHPKEILWEGTLSQKTLEEAKRVGRKIIPKPPELPPIPTSDPVPSPAPLDVEVLESQRARRRQKLRQRGRAGTILTQGGLGSSGQGYALLGGT